MSLGLIYKNEEHIFDEREVEGVPYLSYPMLEETGIVKHGFSTRLGGVSTGYCATMNISTTRGDDPRAVEENCRRMAKAVGVDPADFTYTNQTHTTNVAVVEKQDRGRRFMDTDGMVTDVPGICLVTFYADCVPLFFVDPVHRAIGLSHSGWRGTVGKMGRVTLKLMEDRYGTKPSQVLAAIGPSICRDCYEVSADVIEKFRENFDRSLWPGLFYEKEDGKYQLDLWRANLAVLAEAGVPEERVAVTNLCTHCNPEILFSHRSTGTKRGNLSAFLALRQDTGGRETGRTERR
ncbi:MAG: peptidoglycan editing factor PgeF [Lachnospiraceae bacterium]